MQLADIYKLTGNSNSNFSIRNSTFVFDTNTPNAYRSSVVKFEARLNSPDSLAPYNEINVRWSAAPHTGNSIVKCFHVGFDTKTGQTRIRYEHQHPEYTDALGVGDTVGYSLENSSIAFEFIKLDNMEEKATYFEVNEIRHGDKMRLFSYKDTEHFVEDYPNGCQIAIKINDNTENVLLSHINIEEIEPKA